LGSLGVFGLGKRRVTLIQEALVGKMDTLEDWFSNTLINNAAEAGVKNMAQGIHDELVRQKDYIMKFIKNGLVISQPQPKQELKSGACIICITGALSSPKSKYQTLIENSGNGYTDTFSKSITHLVAADKNGNSNKLEKARKYGITIINEDDLLKLISS
jgi:NAD-dependent DNA ligase